ncbi:MAG: DNA mismatch endonuclease Vsr [Myxococcota bacterium]
MTDTLTPRARSERMRRVRSKNTKPEITVRVLLRSLGYRYRLHGKNLPGKPDLVFPGRRKVIFVHGCFWHRHPDPTCGLARMPKSRLEFWRPKLEGNRRRDLEKQERLKKLGWKFFIAWECELRDKAGLERRIKKFMSEKE